MEADTNDSLLVSEGIDAQSHILDGLQDGLLRRAEKRRGIDATRDLEPVGVRDRDTGTLWQHTLADTGLRDGCVARGRNDVVWLELAP